MKQQKGSALIIIMISLALFAIASQAALEAQLGMLRSTRSALQSKKAYYIAQTGANLTALQIKDALLNHEDVPTTVVGPGYAVTIVPMSPTHFKILSTGTFGDARNIQTTFVDTTNLVIPTASPTPATLPSHCTDGHGHDDEHGNCVEDGAE